MIKKEVYYTNKGGAIKLITIIYFCGILIYKSEVSN